MPNFNISFEAMGSTIYVWLNVPEANDAEVLREIPKMFAEWEARFSRFRPSSELSQLNANPGAWQVLSSEMAEVLTLALGAAEATDGVFNPLILAVLESAGYDHSFTDPVSFEPGKAAHNQASTVVDFRSIEFDAGRRRIRLPRSARLDLGGIVKGWAAEKVGNFLHRFGPCLVDAGGDIVAKGSPDETGGWQIIVPHPVSIHPIALVSLTNAAIATSGKDHRRWVRDGQLLHHLIDPRIGQPAASDVVSATVIAPNGVEAEIWAKTALITGELPDMAALVIREDGAMHSTVQFEAQVIQEAI